ncbi:response regulator [Cellvibrio japonicus]|uniref:Response regulator protein n=1 Tax=Cellvibrio japonicus (strain Ueda107) TaxID=498211 RepID=B3PLE8_CELJU|nr:response regulator [Cellvibrio japonicus]ACE86215.1 response regulator protein [Cellvibrio japonicus Ueda107]QEI11598.1 response regulator [Cellvibrio japonicus]QEI15172.1 response regulator [Cellvibrio japonicus]QEI18752.1 response regulator [Cellvibrio japonicus]
MKRILIVEDSDMVMKVLRHLVQSAALSYEALYATSLAQAREIYDQFPGEFFAALVDLNLPDAANGEIVDFTIGHKIPTIVLTGSYDEQRREQLFAKGIVDYVTKEGRYAYSKAVGMIHRLEKNQQISVLVVDDSDVSRKHMANLFRRHLFRVLEAVDGVDAIKVLLDNPDIKLLITDYNMPRMDGFELVRNLRYKYDKTDLIMIGVSGESSEALSAKFIKHGANDFLRKPFHPEEFYCRIIHNIEALELIEQITYSAQRDHLTGLYHRSYFFNSARELYRQAQEKSAPLSLAVINIDHFSDINRRYGNYGGDQALKYIAGRLEQMLGRFLLARADSDDFFVVMPGLDHEKAVAFLSKVKQLLAAEPLSIQGEMQHFYFSAGVTAHLGSSLDEQIALAIQYLDRAKEAGGNVIVDDGDDDEDN